MNTFIQYLTEASKAPKLISKVHATLVRLGYRLVDDYKKKSGHSYLYVNSDKFATEITIEPSKPGYITWSVGKHVPGQKFSADASGLDSIQDAPNILKDYAG